MTSAAMAMPTTAKTERGTKYRNWRMEDSSWLPKNATHLIILNNRTIGLFNSSFKAAHYERKVGPGEGGGHLEVFCPSCDLHEPHITGNDSSMDLWTKDLICGHVEHVVNLLDRRGGNALGTFALVGAGLWMPDHDR